MLHGTATSYCVFSRTWWRENADWPNGLEPCPGRKHTLAQHCTEDEAKRIASDWNLAHTPGRLSRKAEYDQEEH